MRNLVSAWFLVIALFSLPAGALVPAGEEVHDFVVENIYGNKVSLHAVKTKAIVVFYEDPVGSVQNQAVKDQIKNLVAPERAKADVTILPIADVHHFSSGLGRKIAETNLKQVVHDVGKMIWADWTGDAGRVLDAQTGKSNVYLLDRNHRVVWSHAGPLDADQREYLIRKISGM